MCLLLCSGVVVDSADPHLYCPVGAHICIHDCILHLFLHTSRICVDLYTLCIQPFLLMYSGRSGCDANFSIIQVCIRQSRQAWGTQPLSDCINSWFLCRIAPTSSIVHLGNKNVTNRCALFICNYFWNNYLCGRSHSLMFCLACRLSAYQEVLTRNIFSRK